MEWLRTLRKFLTFGGLRVGMEFSRRVDDPCAVEALRQVVLATAKVSFPIRARLARNMRLSGVYRQGLLDDYFERAVDQMIMLAHVFRAGFSRSGCLERFRFDDSFDLLRQAHAAGRGVINIAPHICGYPVYPAVVSPRIPCAIYMRRNKDPRKMAINQAIGLAGDGELVYPPDNATKAQRLQVALDVLRQGRLMFITPDTPRKPQDGVEVKILNRNVYFPTGVFVMAMRTGAPVVPTFWHWEDGAYRVRYGQPMALARGGKVHERAEAATREWAQSVNSFLREHPAMWWNWLDKRWTRIIREQAS